MSRLQRRRFEKVGLTAIPRHISDSRVAAVVKGSIPKNYRVAALIGLSGLSIVRLSEALRLAPKELGPHAFIEVTGDELHSLPELE